jgi:hypothetical protein
VDTSQFSHNFRRKPRTGDEVEDNLLKGVFIFYGLVEAEKFPLNIFINVIDYIA